MDQEQDTGFNDFMAALDDDNSYRAEEVEQDSPEEQETDTPDGGEEAPDGGDGAPQADPGDQESPEDTPAAEPVQPQEETFTLRVNEEERTCSREEVISLAQKGADYDRVKEQLDGQQEAMDVLADLAKEADTDIPGLLDNFRLNMLKKQGLSDDAAKERLAREKVEKENATLKAAKSAQEPKAESPRERARRELAEFRQAYPDVELTEELSGKLMEAVRQGKTLLESYRSYENAQKDARIAELEQQLAAEKQNKRNRAASPGSQKDSGGRREKSGFDKFMEALQ